MITARCGVYRQRFDSSNQLGIPDLLPDLLWTPEEPIRLVNCGYTPLNRERARGTVFAYWTEDFRLESTWSKPRGTVDRIHAAKVAAMVEPDFSLYTDDPLACQMWNLYRMRWVGRFWQEYGIKVVPNVSWSTPDSLVWSLLGIPQHAPLVAIEGRPRQRKDWSVWARCVAEACERLQPQRVLLYGASAEMAAAVPVPVIAFSAANPRAKLPVRLTMPEKPPISEASFLP